MFEIMTIHRLTYKYWIALSRSCVALAWIWSRSLRRPASWPLACLGCRFVWFLVYVGVLGCLAQDKPDDWSRAGLDEVRAFLVGEAVKGVWKPLPGIPL